MKKKICIVTGSRADYGILKPLLDELRKMTEFKIQIIATGAHCSPEFGLTYREIEFDGFSIDRKIEVLVSSDTRIATCKAMGLAQISFAEAYSELKPDLVVVLGDRFEIFSAVAAAYISRFLIAHLHGGELTEGALDDSLRHCITKMSHLHFTSTAEYRRRVIQLGENPRSVFNVGAIGLDNIKKLELLSRKELEHQLNFRFGNKNLLVTFHPATSEDNTASFQMQALLDALVAAEDAFIIFTKANADAGGRIINKMIDAYAAQFPKRCCVHTSLGQLRYLSIMQQVDAVVGNSSSGIIEAPSFKIGTIDIGDRQKGRIKAKSVISCSPTVPSIKKALRKLYTNDFQKKLSSIKNPYEKTNTAHKISLIIKSVLLNNSLLLNKKFIDLRLK
jgi:GDP/UDP-N,N'-diacetylbacillosamine 2-epimerase (hydrolysing)